MAGLPVIRPGCPVSRPRCWAAWPPPRLC